MPAKPSTGKCDKHNSMVNRHIGTAYDTVKIVADNIETIEEIGDNLPYLLKYLGAYSTPPTERPDGSPLQDGDYYFDSVSEALVYYKLATDEWFEVDPQEILNARDEAIAARDAAQLAQANAETAEANAEASELAAAQSENNAATSASEAATSESNAATSESNAAGSAADALASENAAYASELAAAQSEANASTSESNANLSAQAAATSEANASASETNAAGSAVAAAQSAADAEQAFDNFTDLYLGAKNEDPTTDNDGNPLQVGATYWNIPDTTLLYWSGVVWDSPEETAIQAANTAIAARDDAQISETNAEASADAAALSATDASTSESNAANSASTAQGAATTAGNHATTATNAASAASQSEINAAASELNALASENKAELWAEEDEDVEVEPNRYSAKHWASKAEQEAGVLTWQKHARTGTDLNQMREQHKDVRAASGFDHYGQHDANVARPKINEGLFSRPDLPNVLGMGRGNTYGYAGESETAFPVTQIAGFLSELTFSTTAEPLDSSYIKFSDAPNGTVIYDSSGNARGTGNANLDLTVDVDPKYGDIAADNNEAVARAFEGSCVNGDFRNINGGEWAATRSATLGGFGTGTLAVTAGGGTAGGAASQLIASSATIGEEITVSVRVDAIDNTQLARISVNSAVDLGSGTYSLDETVGDGDEGYYTWTFTAQTTTLYLHLAAQSASNGTTVYYKNASFHRTSEEVVIDRHDMFGGEFFLEEVSGSNPYVYPKGMIQSQATDMNGITAVATNRPATYYAVYTGDTGSNGLGVDFWAATDAEKIAMISDESNNLFLLGDGRLVQWRMRQRTVAGAGNGDWDRIAPNQSDNYSLRFDSNNLAVGAQGHNDTRSDWVNGNANPDNFRGTGASGNSHPETGIFTIHQNSDLAVDDECYFHVWGVVRRLNQGAYHPSFNSLGTRRWKNPAGATNSQPWYGDTGDITSTSQAFVLYDNTVSGVTGAADWTGFIGSNAFGRDDERVYDAIYAGGDGGVNDHRLSAWDMSSKEEAAKVFQKVVNGTYRGEEGLTRTFVGTQLFSTGNKTYVNEAVTNAASGEQISLQVGDIVYIEANDGVTYQKRVITGVSGGQASYLIEAEVNQDTNMVVSFKDGSSVSGEFNMVDVIGDPTEILTTPDLAGGWQGGWVPEVPNGVSKPFAYTRKNLNGASTQPIYFTSNNGASWSSSTATYSATTNSITLSSGATTVLVCPYTTFAKQTKGSVNTPVLNGQQGIGNVVEIQNQDTGFGSLWAESMMDKVCTSTQDSPFENTLLTHTFVNGGLSTLEQYYPKHISVNMPAPTNDSPAVKALWYQVANNQQVSLNFAWNELVWTSPAVSGTPLTPGNQNVDKGVIYPIQGFNRFPDNTMWMVFGTSRAVNWTTGQMDTWTLDWTNGELASLTAPAGGAKYYFYLNVGQMWGDSGKVSITDGMDTYTNLNGDTCLQGTATLSKPIGYSKNHARVGTQTEGVDL